MDPFGGEKAQTAAVNRGVALSERTFDVNTLPADMRRVYGHLAEKYGEEYGLLFIFTMRTAVELHRAWNMTLLTSNILQQIKDKFGLRMTWSLGVVKLKFRVEDGGYELHRKVPYDYDSEYQDVYYRIALALIAGKINVHEALIYQTESKHGVHTAVGGLILRNFPGRLVLYPFQASMCAIIFFSGKWVDAAVAAICGLAAGLVEYALGCIGGQATVLLDVCVGISTGIIGGLWYSHVGEICLSAVFLGTLYWFFYGTAFVIGLLEIMAGELETGVTRFVAVSVKTFVLSLGASLGLMMANRGGASKAFDDSQDHCNDNFTTGEWWRIPIYLACSVGVLGQYRFRIDRYWCPLIVQLVAYEVQYEVFHGMKEQHTSDHLDTATSNIAGAVGGVISACALSWFVNTCHNFYSARLLQEDPNESSTLVNIVYRVMRCYVKILSCLRINRKSEIQKLGMEEKLKGQQKELNDPRHPRDHISLDKDDEGLFLETIVSAQAINIWSILMPAVYQLVPGSVIARFWFHSIFPEEPENMTVPMTSQESVFSNLMGKIVHFIYISCDAVFALTFKAEYDLNPLCQQQSSPHHWHLV